MHMPKFYFITACLACYMSLLMSGVCLNWLEPLTTWYSSNDSLVPMSKDQVSLVVSLVELGAVISPIPTGILADRIGRKWTLLMSGLLTLLAFLLVIFTRSFVVVCIARVLTGMALGSAPTVAPVYIAEISPAKYRGAICGQLMFVFFLGQLVVYVSGHLLDYIPYLWVCCVSPVVFAGLLVVSPESPSYLLKRNQPEQAQEAFSKLRGATSQEEFLEARTGVERDAEGGQGWRPLVQRRFLKILLALQLLSAISHANGLPTLSLYATSTFDGREWLTIAMGGVLAVTSCVAAFFTDSVGRRPLLASSLAGSGLATTVLAVYFYTDIPWLLYAGLVFFCVISSVGISPLIMTLQAELFPPSTRSIASAVTELTLSVSSFLALLFYMPIADSAGMGVNFIIYSVLSFLGIFVVVFMLPETAQVNIDAAHS